MSFAELADELAEIGRQYYARGWVLGTSGNFSAVSSREPLRLAITASGVDKSTISAGDVLEIQEHGTVVAGTGPPSAEASLHLTIARVRGAGAVLHTHSVWGTILSEAVDGLAIEGYEMLKGLSGVHTHEHREWLPVLDNTQEWADSVPRVERALADEPKAHGFLIRGHGLYTWGRDLAEAKRHVEVLEFLFEVIGRKRGMAWQQ